MINSQKIRMERNGAYHQPTSLNLNKKIKIVNFSPNLNFEKIWEKIQFSSDKSLHPSSGFFLKEFGVDCNQIVDRVFFAQEKSSNKIIGTCSAWFKEDWGRVHWVAVLPKYQKQGVANNLLDECMKRLSSLGHSKIYLHTWSDRKVAINLYKKFGFIKKDLFLTQ